MPCLVAVLRHMAESINHLHNDLGKIIVSQYSICWLMVTDVLMQVTLAAGNMPIGAQLPGNSSGPQ